MSGCSYVPWREQGWVGFFVEGCALHTSRTLAALLELRSALNVNRYTHERSLCPL